MKKLVINMLRYLIKAIDTQHSVIDSKAPTIYSSLAPRVLVDQNELLQIKPYLDAIKSTLDNDEIYNIALTGGYGSGKSTIIKTFQNIHRSYKYLNISLASFKDNQDEEHQLERKLEISILQQIFYHVSPSKIPDSRFKRIINITNGKLWSISLYLIVWLLSAVTLFRFDYIDKLNPKTWDVQKSFDWYLILMIFIFSIGIILFAKALVRLFSNSKISKLNIKGELELGDNVDKSVFNQHLEEILYFFERTDFNVVVIEDLDRFENTDIFTKLREINILLNNSTVINRKIKFIYAVRDEMFTDKSERVKFFEFIIPVIPFINPSNAGDQLTKLIRDAKLENVLSKEFYEDVVTFIDDIDMRLLINVFHEYCLYRENLSKELNQDELFSIIVYKNMFPDDFGELSKRKGKLYKFISEKEIYIQKFLDEIEVEISQKKNSIREIENELAKSIVELRTFYLSSILSKLPYGSSLYVNGKLKLLEAAEDESFAAIVVQKEILYSHFTPVNYDTSRYVLVGPTKASFSFSSVENEVDAHMTYKQREKNINDRAKTETLKLEIQKLVTKKLEVESWSLKQIFKEEDIEPFLNKFTDIPLLKNLLLNGYLNENYNDYISLFHEINLTKQDFDFEKKLKSGVALDYNFKLGKIGNLVDKIYLKYFNRPGILNFDLVDYLLSNQVYYKEHLILLFSLLSNDKDSSKKFINAYLDRGENLPAFIKNLSSKWDGFWRYITTSDFTKEKIDMLFILIMKHGEIDDIARFKKDDSNIVSYFEDHSDSLKLVAENIEFERIAQFCQYFSVKILNLTKPEPIVKKLFDFIYQGDYYFLCEENIHVILSEYCSFANELNLASAHYTSILKSGCDKLIQYIQDELNDFVEFVLLDIVGNVNETENVIVDLLNTEDLHLKLKKLIIRKEVTCISDIASIEEIDIKKELIENSKLQPTWINVIGYYDELEQAEFDESLISFLNDENNFDELKLLSLKTIERDEEFVKDISLKIIHSQSLSTAAYKALQNSIPYYYNKLDFSDVNAEKALHMIETSFVRFTLDNYSSLKKEYGDLHIKLLERNSESFMDEFTELSLEENDIRSLLVSDKISENIKVELTEKIDDSFILSNIIIAEQVANLIAVRPIKLTFNIIERCVNVCKDSNSKIRIINNSLDGLTKPEVQAIVEALGGDYPKVFEKQHKPIFPNTETNQKLFSNLVQLGLIKRFEPHDKYADNLKVIANY